MCRSAVIDVLEVIKGNDPNNGTKFDNGVAFASADFIVADRMGCQIMGVDFGNVVYLTYCENAGIGQGDLSKNKNHRSCSCKLCKKGQNA